MALQDSLNLILIFAFDPGFLDYWCDFLKLWFKFQRKPY